MASRNAENTFVTVRRTLTPDELRNMNLLFVKLGIIIVVNVSAYLASRMCGSITTARRKHFRGAHLENFFTFAF